MDTSFLSQTDLDQTFRHAVEEYPYECCGIITGTETAGGNNTVYRCENIQNRLHRENPKEHPRDARTAYYIDPDELLEILKTTREKSYSIKAFYHSHPENAAYFSEEDKKRAMFCGEPTYPGVKHIVISIIGGIVRNYKVFSWDEALKDFIENE